MIAFTISTMGIIEIARPTEIKYSVMPIEVKSKMLARKGISIIAVVRIKDKTAAPINTIL